MTGSTEPRPATLTSKEIAEKASGKDREESWKLKGELWRYKVIDRIIDEMSGTGGDTSEDFQKYYAQVFAQLQTGLDCDEELIALQEYARISGDKQGKNKVQIVQLLEEKAAVFPEPAACSPLTRKRSGSGKD